jgi:hypothetical protein
MPDSDSVMDLSVTQFKIVFECASAIRTLAEVMSNMLETVEVHVYRTEEFRGIKVEAMDPKQISLVVSQLHADVSMEGCEHTAFCVNTKTFHTCVRSAPAHYSISIESLSGSSSIRIVAYEALSNASITRFTLPTLVCDEDPVRFKDIEYKTFIDMDTGELKTIVGMCLKLQGDTLTFRVQQPAEERGKGKGKGADGKMTAEGLEEAVLAKRPKTAVADRRHMVLTISSTGSCTQEHTFYSYVEECGDACVAGKCDAISQVPENGDLETTYEESFGARHLSDFLRSIDRQTVTLRLQKEKPLIMHHKFGNEESYVCLVVAPQVAE